MGYILTKHWRGGRSCRRRWRNFRQSMYRYCRRRLSAAVSGLGREERRRPATDDQLLSTTGPHTVSIGPPTMSIWLTVSAIIINNIIILLSYSSFTRKIAQFHPHSKGKHDSYPQLTLLPRPIQKHSSSQSAITSPQYMVPNYLFLLFSAALTIRLCIIISLEPAVPWRICTLTRIVHWCTYTSDRTERVKD